MIKTNHS